MRYQQFAAPIVFSFQHLSISRRVQGVNMDEKIAQLLFLTLLRCFCPLLCFPFRNKH